MRHMQVERPICTNPNAALLVEQLGAPWSADVASLGICMYAYVCIYMYVNMYIFYMCICTYMYKYIYVYICMYVCVYT